MARFSTVMVNFMCQFDWTMGCPAFLQKEMHSKNLHSQHKEIKPAPTDLHTCPCTCRKCSSKTGPFRRKLAYIREGMGFQACHLHSRSTHKTAKH
ncbi:hCG2038330 [Homo sapiens]|nr:hCG2038330 [Homo sapiens]